MTALGKLVILPVKTIAIDHHIKETKKNITGIAKYSGMTVLPTPSSLKATIANDIAARSIKVPSILAIFINILLSTYNNPPLIVCQVFISSILSAW